MCVCVLWVLWVKERVIIHVGTHALAVLNSKYNIQYSTVPLEPEEASAMLPVLRADNIEESIKQSLLDAGVKDREEVGTDLPFGWLICS